MVKASPFKLGCGGARSPIPERLASLDVHMWSGHCRVDGASLPGPAKYEPGEQLVATDWKMKAVIVLMLVLLAAATVVAYGHADAAGLAAVLQTSQPDEAVSLLLSGSALIGLAGAVRRMTF
jgi:hypothetical protein